MIIYTDGAKKYNSNVVDTKVILKGYTELSAGEVASTVVLKDINTAGKGYRSTIRFGAYCTGAFTWCWPAIQMSQKDDDSERVTITFSNDGYIRFIDNNGNIIRQI